MDEVQVEQQNYQMPPVEGFTVSHFLTVADLKRSAEFYKTVFDGEIVSMGDGNAPPYIKIANTWLILNVGGGPTPDKPTVTLSPPPDPNHISSFMNIRVADIQACYKLWKSLSIILVLLACTDHFAKAVYSYRYTLHSIYFSLINDICLFRSRTFTSTVYSPMTNC